MRSQSHSNWKLILMFWSQKREKRCKLTPTTWVKSWQSFILICLYSCFGFKCRWWLRTFLILENTLSPWSRKTAKRQYWQSRTAMQKLSRLSSEAYSRSILRTSQQQMTESKFKAADHWTKCLDLEHGSLGNGNEKIVWTSEPDVFSIQSIVNILF